MTLTLNALLSMVLRTLRNPREGAAEVLSLGIPRQALGLMLVLTVVLSIVLAQITQMLVTASGMGAEMTIPPIVTGVIQMVLLVIVILAQHNIGRAMGGTGTLPEGVLLITWLQFIMVCLQVIQTLALVVLPPLAGLIGIAGLAIFLWLLTHFIAALHGFRSLVLVFVMVLVSAFGLAFILSILLTMLGVTMPGVMMP